MSADNPLGLDITDPAARDASGRRISWIYRSAGRWSFTCRARTWFTASGCRRCAWRRTEDGRIVAAKKRRGTWCGCPAMEDRL